MPIGSWFQQQLANVAGTAEPIYGPSAIQTVTEQAKTTPYTELSRDDLKWRMPSGTNVETQTFYLFSDTGVIGLVQVIHSNVAGVRETSQFNCKIFNHPDGASPHLWSTNPVEHFKISADKVSCTADNMAVTLNAQGNSYHIKSTTNKKSVVDLTITQTAPGFVAGRDGTSNFGTDPKKPWGAMRHAFWPDASVTGSVITQSGPVDFTGRAVYIHALQGMKPHHAAAKWNFVSFKSPSYSAVLMQFVTPPSYGSTYVSVGGIASGNSIITANASQTATHTSSKPDVEGWPEPLATQYIWTGKTADGRHVKATIEGDLGKRLDKVDVMAEVPAFVKQIVAAAAGTKPYIYQYAPKMQLRIKIGDEEEKVEEGQVFTEATFIS